MKRCAEKWNSTLLGLGTTLVSSWLADLSLRKLYEEPELDHELHKISARDGTNLALWRYCPDTGSKGEPILFVHGLAANHRTFTYHNHSGLIPYLCKQGYDCWAVDLRGRGESEEPAGHWGFDDYAEQDLPAVVDYVLERTDFPRLHWVGYSMGGMLYYVLAGSLDYGSKIASAITIGSPVFFHEPTILDRIASRLHAFPFKLKTVPLSYFLRWIGLGLGSIPETFYLPLVNLNNMDNKILRRFPSVVFATTSSRAVTQYPNWFVKNKWTSREETNDYREDLKNVEVPTLVVAGSRDELCPNRKRAGFGRINTSDKKFVLAGKSQGFSEDYSHLDLIFGKKAHDEVYPRVADWIDGHAMKQTAGSLSKTRISTG